MLRRAGRTHWAGIGSATAQEPSRMWAREAERVMMEDVGTAFLLDDDDLLVPDGLLGLVTCPEALFVIGILLVSSEREMLLSVLVLFKRETLLVPGALPRSDI